MIRGPEGPECHALPSQTENLPERPPGSLFGDNPSGWAFGRMGQIHMGRANPFRALVAGLTADEFLPLREAVDERRSREEVGVGTLAEAAAAYRPDPGARSAAPGASGGTDRPRPGFQGGAAAAAAGGSPPPPAPSSNTAESRSPSGSPSSGSCAATFPSNMRPRKASHESYDSVSTTPTPSARPRPPASQPMAVTTAVEATRPRGSTRRRWRRARRRAPARRRGASSRAHRCRRPGSTRWRSPGPWRAWTRPSSRRRAAPCGCSCRWRTSRRRRSRGRGPRAGSARSRRRGRSCRCRASGCAASACRRRWRGCASR